MNPIINEIEVMQRITTGRQNEYYSDLLQTAKPVNVVSVKDVFTPEEISLIKERIRPKKRQCYRNASLLTYLFPDVMYIEGKAMPENFFPIDHAFNKVGDFYIDITFELVLGEDVTKTDYVVLGEYDNNQVIEVSDETGIWGGCYNYYWKKNKSISL